MGCKDLAEPAHTRRFHVDDPTPPIPPWVRRRAEPPPQTVHQELDLLEREAVRLEGRSCMIGRAVIHEPNAQGQRRQVARDVSWDDLPISSVEPCMEPREERAGPSCELHTWVALSTDPLVEPVKRHRHEVREDVALEFDQGTVVRLVLHVQSMEPAMQGQASIAQQRSGENRSLPASEVLWT